MASAAPTRTVLTDTPLARSDLTEVAPSAFESFRPSGRRISG